MMRPRDSAQIRILVKVHEFKNECALQGIRIDDGQAYECLVSDDSYRLASRFHNLNIRIGKSCGQIHLKNEPDDYFDLAAPESEDLTHDDEDLIEKIQVIPPQTRKILVAAVMEMRKQSGSDSIGAATRKIGVSRSHFYRLLERARWWVTRPPMPQGCDGNDCASLVQMDLDLGVAE